MTNYERRMTKKIVQDIRASSVPEYLDQVQMALHIMAVNNDIKGFHVTATRFLKTERAIGKAIKTWDSFSGNRKKVS